MKRFLLLILLVMTVAWLTSARRGEMHRRGRANGDSARLQASFRGLDRPAIEPDSPELRRETWQDDDQARRRPSRVVERIRHEVNQVVDEIRHEVRDAVAEARHEVREAMDEARRDVHEAYADAGQDVRESADGLPVPIVPGTRVTEAVSAPPTPPTLPHPPAFAPPAPPRPASIVRAPRPPSVGQKAAVPDPSRTREVAGLISATEDRAVSEARRKLEGEIADWLEPEVPRSWKPSPRQVDSLIVLTRVEPVQKPYGTLYVATLGFDTGRRSELVESYQRQLVSRRMAALGGALGFVLICLGAVTGYIRADEATKGYYTNRLRLLAAGGVGAAGMILYQMLA